MARFVLLRFALVRFVFMRFVLIAAFLLAITLAAPVALAGHYGISVISTGPVLPSVVHDGFRIYRLPPSTGSVTHPVTAFSVSTSRHVTLPTTGYSSFSLYANSYTPRAYSSSGGFTFRSGFFCC